MLNYLDEWEKENLGKRLDYVRWLLIFFMLLIIFRFIQLQIFQYKKWNTIASENKIRTIRVLASRGLILDRKGRILAGNRPGFNITVIPADIDQSTIQQLSAILGMSGSELEKKIKEIKRWSPFEPIMIKRNLSWEELAQIEENLRKFSGVDIEFQPLRTYPEGEVACHLLGYIGEISSEELNKPEFANYKMGDFIGKAGVEKFLEKELQGKAGFKFKIVDARGRERSEELVAIDLKPKPPEAGKDVHLTIDLELQRFAHNLLQGKTGAIVMLSTKTGEVLVMESSPGFNPQVFSNPLQKEEWKRLEQDPAHPLYNRAIQGNYPPGSIFKLVVALAGLEGKYITPETEVKCKGIFRLGRAQFKCWRENGHGIVKFRRAIVESCDVYFYTLGNLIGIDQISRFAYMLGLGLKTEIGLDQESRGLLPSTSWAEKVLKQVWNPGDTISASVGQGYILVTPLQAAILAMVIANEGELYRPIIVQKLSSIDKNKAYPPELIQKLGVAKENWLLVKSAMTGVVNEPKGTAYWTVRSNKVQIAGKTGTAQVVKLKQFEGVSESKIPYQFRDHAWFIAFAPAENPEIALSVLVEHGGFGSSGAGPLAKALVEKYFELYPLSRPSSQTEAESKAKKSN